MNRLLSLLLIIALAVSTSGCISSGGGGGSSSSSSGGGSSPSLSEVTLLFNLSGMLAMNTDSHDIMLAKVIDFITMTKDAYAAISHPYDFITSLYVKVTAAGMSDIVSETAVTDPSATISITLTVPNGADRKFYIELKDRNNMVLYSGELTINIGNGGLPQNITVGVSLSGTIDAQDYVNRGRQYLEEHKLELAYIAFNTAVSLEANHSVARFFRGFTHLLLLVQKDDINVNVASPNKNITDALNLYTGSNDIYSSTITPDIYDQNYGDSADVFFTDWTMPSNLSSEDGNDVMENVILPELDEVIDDLKYAEADQNISTTLTHGMHNDIEIGSDIKIDRGDVYILEAIAYGLKAYLKHGQAYHGDTSINYWRDALDTTPTSSTWMQNIIDNDPAVDGSEVFDLASGAATYLAAAKAAFSNGLDKLKAGLLYFKNTRPSAEQEDHAFYITDEENDNIDKIVTNINEVKQALSGPQTFTSYDNYGDKRSDYPDGEAGEEAYYASKTVNINLFNAFDVNKVSTRDNLPRFYTHVKSETVLPILDNNKPTSDPEYGQAFINSIKNVLLEYEGTPINTLEDALKKDIIPPDYKFDVPVVEEEVISMNGNESDFTSADIKPVAFNDEDLEIPDYVNITKLYMAKDSEYLYIGLKLRGLPYTTDLVSGEELDYHIHLCANRSGLGWNDALMVQLRGYPSEETAWEWREYYRGEDKGVIANAATLGFSHAIGDMVELRIPLSYIKAKVDEYESADFPPPAGWDGKEIFFGVCMNANITEDGSNHDSIASDCLAKLN